MARRTKPARFSIIFLSASEQTFVSQRCEKSYQIVMEEHIGRRPENFCFRQLVMKTTRVMKTYPLYLSTQHGNLQGEVHGAVGTRQGKQTGLEMSPETRWAGAPDTSAR